MCWQLRKENTIKEIGRNTDQPKPYKPHRQLKLITWTVSPQRSILLGNSMAWLWLGKPIGTSQPSKYLCNSSHQHWYLCIVATPHKQTYTQHQGLQIPDPVISVPPCSSEIVGDLSWIKIFECWRETAEISVILNRPGWSNSDKIRIRWELELWLIYDCPTDVWQKNMK